MLQQLEKHTKKFASRNLTSSQISAPEVWHAHSFIQFHTMVAKISQSSRKDRHIIWNQMLLIKCQMKSTRC